MKGSGAGNERNKRNGGETFMTDDGVKSALGGGSQPHVLSVKVFASWTMNWLRHTPAKTGGWHRWLGVNVCERSGDDAQTYTLLLVSSRAGHPFRSPAPLHRHGPIRNPTPHETVPVAPTDASHPFTVYSGLTA